MRDDITGRGITGIVNMTNVTANYFFGDGSGLTNVAAGNYSFNIAAGNTSGSSEVTNADTVNITGGSGVTVTRNGEIIQINSTGSGGSGSHFIDVNVSGDTGNIAILDNESLTIAGGTGISTAAAGNTVTVTNSLGANIDTGEIVDGTILSQDLSDSFTIDCSNVTGETGDPLCTVTDTFNTSAQMIAAVNASGLYVFDISGNAGTATALAANGANCAAGEIALGVDASGVVEGCYEPTEADITDLVHTTDTNCTGNGTCSLIVYDDDTTSWDKDSSDDIPGGEDSVQCSGTDQMYNMTLTVNSSGVFLVPQCSSQGTGSGMTSWLIAAGNTTGSGTVTNSEVVNITGGTGITVTRSNQTLQINSTVVDTFNTTEQIQDVAGGMINTQTGISVVYDDPTGTIDYIVDVGATIDDTDMTAEDFGSWTCTGSEDGCTLDASSVTTSHITDNTVALADVTHTDTLGGNPALAVSQCYWASTGIICEGSTNNTIETLLTFTNPTSTDKTITFPDATGDVVVLSSSGLAVRTAAATFAARTITAGANGGLTVSNGNGVSGNPTLSLSTTATLSGDHSLSANGAIFGANGIIFEGSSADTIETYLSITNPTSSDKTITFPDLSGTVSLFGSSVDDTEMTAEDFGDFTCTGGEDGCTLDASYLTAESDPLWVANLSLVGFLDENENVVGVWNFQNNLTANGSKVCTPSNGLCNQTTTTQISEGTNLYYTTARVAAAAPNITLAGTPDYLTIANQVITRNAIDLATDVTGELPDGNLADILTVGAGSTVNSTTLTQEGATSGQVLEWNGSHWAPGTDDTSASAANVTGSNGVNNRLGVWTNATNIEGASDLLWDGNNLSVSGVVNATGDAGGCLSSGPFGCAIFQNSTHTRYE